MTSLASSPSPAPQLLRAMPVLEVADMARSLDFYKSRLGCDADVWGEPATFAILQRGAMTVALVLAEDRQVVASRRHWAAYIYVADVDAIHAELSAHGVACAEAPKTQSHYACRDFTIDDPDGHMLAFGQVLGRGAATAGLSARTGRDALAIPERQ